MAGPSDLATFQQNGLEVPQLKVHHFPYIAELALEYSAKGHEVHVFTTSPMIDEVVYLEASPSFSVTIIPQRRSNRRALDMFRLERDALASEMRKSRLEVIHSHWLYEYSSAALATGVPTLVTCHDAPFSVLRHYRGVYWWFREILGIRVLLAAKHLTAVAPSLEQELRRTSFWTKQIVVVPNGVKHQASEPTARPLEPSKVTFACIAKGFSRRKNSSKAIEAFARLSDDVRAHARLLLIGSGHEENGDAHSWAQTQKMDLQNIHFLGELPHQQVVDYLHSSIDVLVHPSRWEACSLAIIEAGARGIPTIGGQHSGGVGFTIGGARCGFPVNVRKVGEIAHAMRCCILEEDRISAKSVKISRYVHEKFDLEDVIESYLEHLNRIRR